MNVDVRLIVAVAWAKQSVPIVNPVDECAAIIALRILKIPPREGGKPIHAT